MLISGSVEPLVAVFDPRWRISSRIRFPYHLQHLIWRRRSPTWGSWCWSWTLPPLSPRCCSPGWALFSRWKQRHRLLVASGDFRLLQQCRRRLGDRLEASFLLSPERSLPARWWLWLSFQVIHLCKTLKKIKFSKKSSTSNFSKIENFNFFPFSLFFLIFFAWNWLGCTTFGVNFGEFLSYLCYCWRPP